VVFRLVQDLRIADGETGDGGFVRTQDHIAAQQLIRAALDDFLAVPHEERMPCRHHSLGPSVESNHELVLRGDAIVPHALDAVELVDASRGIDGERLQVQVRDIDVTAAPVELVNGPPGVAKTMEEIPNGEETFSGDVDPRISRSAATSVFKYARLADPQV